MVFINGQTSSNFFFNFNINLGGHQACINSSALDSTRALGLLNQFFADGFGAHPGLGSVVAACGGPGDDPDSHHL